MDWNIFFSTVSQTTGAIVGIFAAFLITKIVANQSEYSRNKEKASDYIHRSRALVHESETRYFEWYNQRTAENELSEIDDSFDETDEILSAEEYYKKLDFSPFQDKKEALKLIQNKVDELTEKKRIEEERVRSELDRMGPGHPVLLNMQRHVQKLGTLTVNTTEEREQIDNLLVRTTMQSKMNHDLFVLLRIGSESSPLVSVSIVAVILLFFSGVIYPLSFLPLNPSAELSISLGAFWDILFSLKGLLLVMMSITFCGLMLIFLIINNKLKHDVAVLEELEKYSCIGSYSEYFHNYICFQKSLNNSMQPTADAAAD
ncbi:hypothetical protein ALON55S_03768 [Alishewanella longhuensis]